MFFGAEALFSPDKTRPSRGQIESGYPRDARLNGSLLFASTLCDSTLHPPKQTLGAVILHDLLTDSHVALPCLFLKPDSEGLVESRCGCGSRA